MKPIFDKLNQNLSFLFTDSAYRFFGYSSFVGLVLVIILPFLNLTTFANWLTDLLFFVIADVTAIWLSRHHINFIVSLILGVTFAFLITIGLDFYISYMSGKIS